MIKIESTLKVCVIMMCPLYEEKDLMIAIMLSMPDGWNCWVVNKHRVQKN